MNTIKDLGKEIDGDPGGRSLEALEVRDVEPFYYNDYVYDLVIPPTRNFITPEGLILHNTQICHQLAVNVQLTPEKGGLGGSAVYIDTEGTFRWERIEAMARGKGLDPDEVMDKIYFIRAVSSDHQIAIIEELRELIPERNIKLVIVDSVTGHFRAEYPGRENLAVRQQKLNKHLHQLQSLAEVFNIAVVITNQVMARPDVFYGDPTVAVGGHIVGHAPGIRVQLRKSRGNKRIARVIDAPHLPEGEAIFVITETGIADATE
jgi:DNA repair protein RadA